MSKVNGFSTDGSISTTKGKKIKMLRISVAIKSRSKRIENLMCLSRIHSIPSTRILYHIYTYTHLYTVTILLLEFSAIEKIDLARSRFLAINYRASYPLKSIRLPPATLPVTNYFGYLFLLSHTYNFIYSLYKY